MALSKVQKAAIAESAAKVRSRSLAVKMKLEGELGKTRQQLKKTHETNKGETMITGVGTVAGGALASQVHREIAIKRERPGLARIINYGMTAIGLFAAYKAKPTAKGQRIAGASLAGLGAGQMALDLADVDLVPGFND